MSYRDIEIVFYNIWYDVGLEDLERENEDRKKKYKSVNDLHNSLPTEVTTQIRIDDDYLDDNESIFDVNDYEIWDDYDLANELSNATGWCVCGFDYVFPHIESDFIRFKGVTHHALDEFILDNNDIS